MDDGKISRCRYLVKANRLTRIFSVNSHNGCKRQRVLLFCGEDPEPQQGQGTRRRALSWDVTFCNIVPSHGAPSDLETLVPGTVAGTP